MSKNIYIVDAFTDQAFKGNPAAISILQETLSEEWMQQVAKEMNLSETAFILPAEGGYQLRWFTPETEVPLCGHATLAAAHILWTEGYVESERIIEFHTLSGVLTAQRSGSWIELEFPAMPPQPLEIPSHICEVLGIKPIYSGHNLYHLLEVGDEQQVTNLQPDFRQLRAVSDCGIVVTSRSSRPRIDFVSRFFDPADGIDEDPVTGSAHCLLAPYWAEKLGKSELVGYQASQRGGLVKVRLSKDRVVLAGQAITVLRGVLTI